MDYQYFLALMEHQDSNGTTRRRWIEWKGIMLDKFFDQITIQSAMGGKEVLHPAIGPLTHKEMLKLKPKLNSEIVMREEPDLIKVWKDTYNKTHRK